MSELPSLELTPTTTPKNLSEILGLKLSHITYIAHVLKSENLYKSFEIPKKSGGQRKILAPNDKLKIIQSSIKKALELIYKPHPAASAFIVDRGILYNAKRHLKKRYVFNIDLANFYDQIHFGRIKGLLVNKPYCLREDTANLIANLCCANGVLPQGAPTSPILSNMIARRMDKELSLLAKSNNSQYTRYADDITFSFISDKINSIVDFETKLPKNTLLDIISKNGFHINDSKTRLQSNKERQVVTGLKVNNKINVDRRYVRTTRAMLHSLICDIDEARSKYNHLKGNELCALESVVLGRINFIGMIKGRDSTVYRTLAIKFNSLEINLKARVQPQRTHSDQFDNDLSFNKHERKILNGALWVVEFSGIDAVEDDLVQGTAFSIKSGLIITALHTFTKAGSFEYCYLWRITEPHNKYKARQIKKYEHLDIAVLEIVDEKPKAIQYLEIYANSEIDIGYNLKLAGFPQLQLGHASVSIENCKVKNKYIRSKMNFIEVDKPIMGGLSGGPLLNSYMQVVGMALIGWSVAKDIIEGNNACISAEHFLIENLNLEE